ADVPPSRAGSGALGKPAVCVSRCSRVTLSKPGRAKASMWLQTSVSGASTPSAIATQTAAATSAFVTE
ncbi:MAG: hypothetical protein QOD98_2459, partial [Nocardioidaceae bacterium]|nr:hypothetical protein [Nocardioidaceae bacterium]